MTPSGPTVVFRRVRLRSGQFVEAELAPGVHTFLAEGHEPLAEEALQEVGELLTGWVAPRRGRVLVCGQSPHRHPATRQRIASVLGVEPALIGRDVAEHLARLDAIAVPKGVDGAREKSSNKGQRLERVLQGHPWLKNWSQRPAATLQSAERRTLAAAWAFSAERPLLVVLHEPTRLGTVEFAQPSVLARIHRWQEEGVTVVCTTSDARVAARLGGTVWTLSRQAHASSLEHAEYLVRSSAARALAARLADHPAVVGLRYEETLPRDLWVRGNELDPLLQAILASVLAEGCELYELTRLRRVGAGSLSEAS